MKQPFSIHTTPHYERLFEKLFDTHPELDSIQKRAREILEADPYNRSRAYPIKKLKGVRQGEGQYRLRSGRWRLRYDIYGKEVWLFYCGFRREETYK